MAVVLAADGGSVASVAGADTDDADWGAVKADVAVEVGEDNAQGTEQAGLRGGLSLMSRDRILVLLDSQSGGGETPLTLWTDWQHWMGPVLQFPAATVPVAPGAVTVIVVVTG